VGEETVRAVLDCVAEEWRVLRADRWVHRRDYGSARLSALPRDLWDPREGEVWPWGVWIKLHEPVSDDADEPRTPVNRRNGVARQTHP
jgi:hypothetical protein